MDCIDNDLDWNAEPMAIDLAEPNTYQTACGKGYWECAANEPNSITLANAGVLIFIAPSATTML
jgi:hypothetical protein